MIALYDHIQELKAELRYCRMTRRERADAENELAQAIAEHVALWKANSTAPSRCCKAVGGEHVRVSFIYPSNARTTPQQELSVLDSNPERPALFSTLRRGGGGRRDRSQLVQRRPPP